MAYVWDGGRDQPAHLCSNKSAHLYNNLRFALLEYISKDCKQPVKVRIRLGNYCLHMCIEVA